MANAGVDHSNLESNHDEKRVLLLPENPDRSSACLKESLDKRFDTRVGVVINDSCRPAMAYRDGGARPWRRRVTRGAGFAR